jgi:hypothetical protein
MREYKKQKLILIDPLTPAFSIQVPDSVLPPPSMESSRWEREQKPNTFTVSKSIAPDEKFDPLLAAKKKSQVGWALPTKLQSV